MSLYETFMVWQNGKINVFMKKMAICLAALLYMAVNAQDFYDEFRAKSIDVEGVKIDHKMTYDQFVAKFGKPTEYTQSDSGEGGESSIDEYYKREFNIKLYN